MFLIGLLVAKFRYFYELRCVILNTCLNTSCVDKKISFYSKKNVQHQEVDLKTQMSLLGTGQDLYREALDSGRITEDLNMKVFLLQL